MEVKQAQNFFYRINKEETENTLCSSLNTCKQGIKRNNSNLKYYVGEWVEISTNDFDVHYVKPTETLTEIAKKHNTTVEKLMADNNLKTDKLFIGQSLKIRKLGSL